MENLRERIGDYTIYSENYLRMWKKIQEKLIVSLKNAGYRIVTARTEKELDIARENYPRNGIFLYSLSIVAISYHDDLLSARSRCFNALGEYSEWIGQTSALSVTEGCGADDSFLAVVFLEDGKWSVGAKIRLEQIGNRWKVTEIYTDEILEAVEHMTDRLHLIAPDIGCYPFGIVLTDRKDPESLRLAKMLRRNRSAFLPDEAFSVKKMYEKMELEGIASVIEIRKHGRFRHRNLLNDTVEICSESDIDRLVEGDAPMIFKKILSESVTLSLRCAHVFLCESCLRKEKRYWVRPFRQRAAGKKCARCGLPAESEIFFQADITK